MSWLAFTQMMAVFSALRVIKGGWLKDPDNSACLDIEGRVKERCDHTDGKCL